MKPVSMKRVDINVPDDYQSNNFIFAIRKLLKSLEKETKIRWALTEQ